MCAKRCVSDSSKSYDRRSDSARASSNLSVWLKAERSPGRERRIAEGLRERVAEAVRDRIGDAVRSAVIQSALGDQLGPSGIEGARVDHRDRMATSCASGFTTVRASACARSVSAFVRQQDRLRDALQSAAGIAQSFESSSALLLHSRTPRSPSGAHPGRRSACATCCANDSKTPAVSL